MNRASLIAIAVVASLSVACGGSSPDPTGTSAAGQTVVVETSPVETVVGPGKSVRFTAQVTGSADTSVTWSVDETGGGTIDSNGLYTAPAAEGTFHVTAEHSTQENGASKKYAGKSVVHVSKTAVAQPVAVTVSPGTARVPAGGSATFAAAVTNTTNLSVTWSVQPGSNCGSISSSGVYTAPPAGATCTVVATSAADTTKNGSATVTVTTTATQPGGSGPVARPSYNTGVGFFTLNGKLYDANGNEFKIKGTNTAHYDESWSRCTSNCGIPNAKFNVNRTFMPLWSGISNTTVTNVLDRMISQGVVPMPTIAHLDSTYSVATTGSNDVARLNTAVSQWVARAALLKPYERSILINIANEWGPGNSSAWRDAYISAISTLRAAGYLNTIVIDSGYYGQDHRNVVTYGQAVYDADPQHNILFSVHVYGNYGEPSLGIPIAPEDWAHNFALSTSLDALQATGLPVVLGEFGPGRNIGPSPTELTPATVIQFANARNIGWMAWAWDDGGETFFGQTNNKQFSLTAGVPTNGAYPSNTDLTTFGNEVILNPTFGTFVAAQKATIFP
jgi:hypothetical protein